MLASRDASRDEVRELKSSDEALAADEAYTANSKADSARSDDHRVVQREATKISASRGFGEWLAQRHVSLALTSYQTGQLMLIGSLPGGRISLHETNFVRAMGLIAQPERLIVSSIAQIWRLENALGPGQLANQNYDRLYVPRNAQTTGDLAALLLG